jgi:molybdenum cofactor cytidylyltransferase
MEPEPTGLLLAAGRGTRFDPSGRLLKLLSHTSRGPLGGDCLAAAAARTLIASLPRVIAVVRPADSDAQRQLHAILRSEGCVLAVCDDADAGISASIACGVRTAEQARGWVVALADMPAILPSTVRAVALALPEGALTAAPVYQGQRGHPVGFAASFRPQLLALTGDTGARELLVSCPPQLIAVNDPGVVYDVDTKERD